jgi:hypothetical protein
MSVQDPAVRRAAIQTTDHRCCCGAGLETIQEQGPNSGLVQAFQQLSEYLVACLKLQLFPPAVCCSCPGLLQMQACTSHNQQGADSSAVHTSSKHSRIQDDMQHARPIS